MRKTNVKYLNKDFYYNPEKKTTICKLEFTVDLNNVEVFNTVLDNDSDFNIKLFDWFDNHDLNWTINYDKDNTNYIFRVIGKAVCSDEDVYDEAFGKNLSLTRAQQKAFTVAEGLYGFIIHYIAETYMKPVCDLEDGCTNSLSSVYEHEMYLFNK